MFRPHRPATPAGLSARAIRSPSHPLPWMPPKPSVPRGIGDPPLGILIPVALVIWLSVNVSAIRRSQEDIARSLRMTVEEMKSQRLRSPQGRS
jgi:hypothetical protein